MHPYNKTYEYLYVNTSAQLSELCAHYATQEVLAIDTEFVRTQTLTPILGLIQVFDKEQVALIDPVAIADLSEFAAILTNANIVKIAHACSEDLEALWHHLQVIPTPIFDTQFAAGLIGLGVSVGYANLIEKLFEITVDKGESRTDWIQRPLSAAQCAYASADVTHLMALYEHIFKETQTIQKTNWVFDEIHQLGVKKSMPLPAEIAYYSLKNNWKLKGKQLIALKALAKWRLEVARKENMAVNFVIKEVALFEIASKVPDTAQALFDCHNLYSKQARLYKDDLLAICQAARNESNQQAVPRIQRLIEFSGYKPCLNIVKELVDHIALEQDVPVAVLASKKQMNQVLKWCWFDFDELELQNLCPDMLSGWRGELFSAYIQGSQLFNNINLQALIAGHHEIKRSL
ncbi:MAG: ribonuclease D [Kangiellaceae bacterium]